VVVTAGMLLQMLLQIGLQSIISRQLGAGPAVDAFEGAVAIPLAISAMVTLPLGAVLIPLMARAAQRSEDAAWEAAGTVALCVMLSTGLLAGALILARVSVLSALYTLTPGKLATAAEVLSMTAWLVPFNAVIAVSQALLHWHGRFALPAVAGVLGPAVTLGMMGFARGSATVQLLAQAMVLGAAANALVQLPSVLRRLRWRWSTETLRSAARLVGPVLLGAIYWRIDPLIDRSIGSRFDEGTLASLGYCSRVTNTMAALAAGGLSVVAFPRMSSAAAEGDQQLARETSKAVGASLLILIPLATAWFLFGEAIIRDLFEGGRFTQADTARVALFIRCAIGVVIGGSIGEILGRTFYAKHDTLTPVLIGSTCVTVGFALKWLFSSFWGPSGVLVASSFAMLASAGLQFFILRGRLGQTLRTFLFTDGVDAMMATGLACLAGWGVLQTGLPFPAFAGGAAGLAVYLAALSLLRSRRLRTLAG
jgi:putative peptidoglycan lipid II flippase